MGYSFLFLLILLPIFPFSAVAQTQGNITVGATLSATADSSDSWLSPSGDFAFGFSKTENKQFLLSIWFNKIPEKTIVWYANEGNFVESKVQLTAEKGLVLTSPQGDEIWKSEPLIGTVSFAHMNDTGSFMIKDQLSRNLWESFDFPTDTILPFQTIKRHGFLNSMKKERDFSPGRFRLTLFETGNLALTTVSIPLETNVDGPWYYVSNTNDDANISNSGVSLVFNESGYLYVSRANGQSFMLTEDDAFPNENFYHRATINFDGVFTQYYLSKTSTTRGESWSTLKVIPDDICQDLDADTGSGACGYNGICTLGIDKKPFCRCPPGYSLLDPNDTHRGCKPNCCKVLLNNDIK